MECNYCGEEGATLALEAEFSVKSQWNFQGTPSIYFCGVRCLTDWMFDDGLLHWKGE